MKRQRMEADNRGRESTGDHTRRRKSTLPIYTVVPSPDTGRLVVTFRRQGANGSSRMASPDSTVDTMGDVTNISHSRKERGSLAERHQRPRNDVCPYARHNEPSGRLDAEDGLKVAVLDESSSSVVVKGHCLPHKVALKRSRKAYLEQQRLMQRDLNNDQEWNGELFGDLAQRQQETARSDLNNVQEGPSILQGSVESKSDSLDQVSITSTGCTSTSVEYDATIDDE